MSDRQFESASLAERDMRHLREQFRAGRTVFVQSLSESAQAWLALALHKLLEAPLVWVVDSPKTLDILYQDITTLCGEDEGLVSYFPSRDTVRGTAAANADVAGDRLATLQRCLSPEGPAIVATCVQALFQPTPPPASLRRASLSLSVSQEIEMNDLTRQLAEAGYSFEVEVQQKGQAAVRGGIVDFWPPTESWPVRLEFFGDSLDSIRAFDPVEQRSKERIESVVVSPAAEMLQPAGAEFHTILSYLPGETRWAWGEPDSIHHHAEMYRAMLGEDDPAFNLARIEELRLRVEKDFPKGQLVVGMETEQTEPLWELDLLPIEGLPSLDAEGVHPDVLDKARRDLVANLGRQATAGHHVRIYFNTEGARDRFLEMYRGEDKAIELIDIKVSPLSEGFSVASRKLIVVSESDLYGFRKRLPGRYELHGRRKGPSKTSVSRVVEWTDIQPGEYVVHVDHGIGKYLGLYEIEFDGQQQEVLAIEYADKAKLYVPVSQTHLLSRYVGSGRTRPQVHVLGGKRWVREKIAAEKAVQDLASALLETQAARETLEGFSYARDTQWQHELEAAFPYQETEDQHRAIVEVKQDMESRKPMDRLICGDVGYGKTEVAMRAAFKAVMDGKQVAVLVPTTILAQQHYDTFTERMAAYPVSIEVLSRFRTKAQQQDAVRRIADGSVDIVIGTHRLLQRDVKFDDLGLVIVDEEQRFGVTHKEHLKHLRKLVDVLTMTATPIPRTLYMSLTGAKDMSTIQTPPQERLPVETIVTQNTDEVVREAILRELNRGGQVFFLHNRVMSIETVRKRLEALVPEASVEVGHGQMHEKELASIMHRFVRGEFDVLLCTTIIESGVDIPNVNTILIDRADRFGMADLYQLRGRVGRYKHKAYAYLLLPRHGRLFDNARKRIGGLKRYSSLGAGFKLALRDLEIRGAGNLLGAEQSGHIAAVGFDLYCQLLKVTVARMKGETPPPIIEVQVRLDFIDLSLAGGRDGQSAVIPSDYIEDENLRVGMYRKIASSATEAEITALYEEARDRFGPIPEAMDRLLTIARLRIVAAERSIQSIEVRDNKALLMRDGDYLMPGGLHPRLKASGATSRLDELIKIARRA